MFHVEHFIILLNLKMHNKIPAKSNIPIRMFGCILSGDKIGFVNYL